MQFGPEMRSPCLSDNARSACARLRALGVAALAELRGIDQRALEPVRRRLGERVDDWAATG